MYAALIECDAEPIVLNGHFLRTQDSRFVREILLHCDIGYQIKGNNSFYTCSFDGRWSGTAQCGMNFRVQLLITYYVFFLSSIFMLLKFL